MCKQTYTTSVPASAYSFPGRKTLHQREAAVYNCLPVSRHVMSLIPISSKLN